MSGSQPVRENLTMRYSQGDLAILSAEIYTPGLPYSAPGGPAVTKKTPLTRTEEGPRKRAKRQSPEETVEREEEEKKRTRGRPRLDVKDETAADRRRTQIRLAQRAYRNRKENAIQTLERKVQDLKDTNEEMSNAFMQLHDFAMNAGILDRIPEFGRHLRLTTERFLSLARQASEDGAKDDDAGNGSVHNSDGPAEHAKSSSPEVADVVPTTATEKPKGQTILYGGVMVSHEPLSEIDLLHDFASDYVPPTSSALDFEVITQPTLENASFPFGSTPEFDFASFSSPSPYSPLPLPKTYTSQEATFGRRLHRFATERALFLISMPYPNLDRFNEVFGFCLLIETRDVIHARLRRTVGRNIQENLSNWQYPFYHLGGAGTHFDADDMAAQRARNEDTIDVLKPNSTAGFSTGPFTPDIVGVQENALDKGMRMDLSGFRDDFFDCDEVELYLHHRGIIIPPGADHITAEIDPANLGNGPAAPPSYSATTPSFAALTAPTGALPDHNPFAPRNSRSNASSTSSLSPAPSTEVASTAAQQPSSVAWSFGAGQASLVDPLLSGVFSGTSHGSYMAMAAATTSGVSGPASSSAPSASPRRETVAVDVNLLIQKLTSRATCLGRAPGFRQQDINEAFWKAARVVGS